MTVCDDVQIKYAGDGIKVLFIFPFEYSKQSDVKVGFYNEDTGLYDEVAMTDANHPWLFENATTIRFTTAPTTTEQFKIYRNTTINQAVFSPGSAIRAQDLNKNFDLLELAIDEGRCADENIIDYVDEHFLKFNTDVTKLPDQLAGTVPDDDEHVMSNAVSIERYDVLVGTTPSNPTPSQEGKWWVDTTEERISYWNSDIGAWVDTSQSGPFGPQGPAGVAGRVEISDTAPTVMYRGTADERPIISGDLWLDSTRAILYVWYVDRTGGQWIAGGARGPAGPEGQPGQDGQNLGIPEAPLDGEIYGRQNGNWVTNFVTGNNLQEPLELTAGGQVQINLQNLNSV